MQIGTKNNAQKHVSKNQISSINWTVKTQRKEKSLRTRNSRLFFWRSWWVSYKLGDLGCRQKDGEAQRHEKCKLMYFYCPNYHIISFPYIFPCLLYLYWFGFFFFLTIQSCLDYTDSFPYSNFSCQKSSISLVFLLPTWLSGQRKKKKDDYSGFHSYT